MSRSLESQDQTALDQGADARSGPAGTSISPLQRLWVKLLIGFGLVALVAVGVVGILAYQATTRQFRIYVSQGRQMRAERLAPEFAAYYARTGGWAGIADWMASLTDPLAAGQRQGFGRGRAAGWESDRLVLADARGEVLADSSGVLKGQRLSGAELAAGVPVLVGSTQVGTLLIPAAGSIHESLEAEFLRQVNNWLLWAGLIAGGVAIVLGLVLARQLTAPLRTLTNATRHLAQEKFVSAQPEEVPQVPIRSRDEIGELSQAFNQMAQSLADQERLRRNLMADIAHELRTPLSVIRSDLEALLDGVYEPTPETLASLHEETLLLGRLVDDLRALALAEAGELRLARQTTDLAELLDSVVESFDVQAEDQAQALLLEMPPHLPQVDVDPQRVRQIVANLVSNGLRHAPRGGRVIVAAGVIDGYIQISVIDDGPGVPADDLSHVFDRFWQGDRAPTGTSGLGLAIARELVQAHGGSIWAESTPGSGAAFRFTLPLRAAGSSGRTPG
jgi:two-component system OmpR family sensor kinase/two-component system sensor histidine kinase BaeS